MCSVMGKFLSSFAQSEGISRVGNSPFRFDVHVVLCWEWYLCIGDFFLATFSPIWGHHWCCCFKMVLSECPWNFGTDWDRGSDWHPVQGY